MLASAVALCGVIIIVGQARGRFRSSRRCPRLLHGAGDRRMTVMVRRHRNTSMVAAAAMSNILGSVISIPFAHGIAA
jgi:hypothetical protein